MALVQVNGQEVDIGSDRINLIQAAQQAGVEIPHYCWHPKLSVVASCRMCLVEVGQKKEDGSVAMQPKLFPACQTPASDGTVVVTDSPKVKQAQAATLEYLLLNHPLDCPTCDQAGECFLQDYDFNYGKAVTRLQEPKLIKMDKPYIGDQITLFTDRCVMCSRCVRFTREIAGTSELQIVNRGSHAEIDVFPGHPCNNKLAGNVVDICPVGALCSKDFLYKQRVWWLKSADSVCTGCSTGCSVRVDQNRDHVYRLKPRVNPKAQGHFMCDEGRFGFKYLQSDDRLQRVVVRSQNGNGGVPTWETVLPKVREALASKATAGIAAVLSPFMTCEEAYLLAGYLKGIAPDVKLYSGPIPVVGEDDHFPKNAKGVAYEPYTFTIRAEKCPNRLGVELVAQHFDADFGSFDDFLAAVGNGSIKAAYIVGGYPESWITPEQAQTLAQLELSVVQDILPNPLVEQAHYVLPGGSFAERDGTFVNYAGLAQGIHRAISSPGMARSDGRTFWELAGRTGLFHADDVRKELGQTVGAFAPLAGEPIGELGLEVGAEATAAT